MTLLRRFTLRVHNRKPDRSPDDRFEYCPLFSLRLRGLV